MKKYIITLITCCAAGTLLAQHHTLKSCLETGLEKNYSIRLVRNQEQISKNNATIANADKSRVGRYPALAMVALFLLICS